MHKKSFTFKTYILMQHLFIDWLTSILWYTSSISAIKEAQGSSQLIEYNYLYTKKIFTWKFDNSSFYFQEELLFL